MGARPAGFLACEELLSHFGQRRQGARARYRELVEGTEDLPSPAHRFVVGDDDFTAYHLALVEKSPEYPRAALRPGRRPLSELVSSASDVESVARAHLDYGYSMRTIAAHLGCGIATVHRRVRSFEGGARGTWKT